MLKSNFLNLIHKLVLFITGRHYQLDFVTPGNSPLFAISRKQIR
ncbi:MAG: hypothetical protein ACD_57C00239G0005, partial [uncultured bacterium]